MIRNLVGIVMILSVFHAIALERNRYQLNVGPAFNYARYNLGCLPKIHGYLAGVHADFQADTTYCMYAYADVDARFNAGFVCGCDDTKSCIQDVRTQLFVGYNWDGLGEYWQACQEVTLTPFFGVGFYFLSNELHPDIIDYRYFNVFIPLGFNVHWDVCPDNFAIELQALYRLDAWTRLNFVSPCIVDEECPCEKLCLNRSHGFHCAMPLIWHDLCEWEFFGCNTAFQMKVVPFFDWNRFGSASEANSNGLCFEVPQLDQWYLGLHVDFGIAF
jgi:hypothetical protein